MRKIRYYGPFILVGILVAILSLGALPAGAADKVYRMKIQSAWPRGDLSMELLADFADMAAEYSNGQVKIQVFASPELVPGEQLFEATQKGTLDMLHALGAMWGGIVPIGEIEFGLPYMWNVPGDHTVKENAEIVRKFFFDSGFVDLLRREYAKQGLYWLDMHSYGELFTLCKEPIKNCQELQGKKMRVEGAWMDFYNAVGARGTYISGEEAYMGLKLGTIDCSQWDVSAITGLNWHEVAPYRLRGGGENNALPGHILFNKKKWDSLPDDVQKALARAAKDYFDKLNDLYMGEYKKVDELENEGKLKEIKIDAACEKAHREAAYALWDKIGERDPSVAEGIKLIKKWREGFE
jgi:TRAP-type C4-dicarboxylate transport system substrate-binding protein